MSSKNRIQEIEEAAEFIGEFFTKYLRLNTIYKEKFGEVRVYVSLEYYTLTSILNPGPCYVPLHLVWLHKLETKYHTVFDIFFGKFNRLMEPILERAYRWRYKKAVQKWPHLYRQILDCADYPHLLAGLEKYGVDLKNGLDRVLYDIRENK